MTVDATFDEKALLTLVADGDEKAFGLLVDRYSRKVFIHILTFVKSYELAEEMAQDVFVKIWKHRAGLAAIKNFPDYLFIICRNDLVSFLRKKLPAIVELQPAYLEKTSNHQSMEIELKELQQRMDRAINRLRPQQQKVFRMSREEGLTYQEIAAQLQLSPETIKWHLAEALNQLRIILKEQGDLLLAAWLCYDLFLFS